MGGAARGDILKRIWTGWFVVGSSSIGVVCHGSRSVNRDACLSIVAGVLSLCPLILCLRPSPWHRPASRAYFLPHSVCPTSKNTCFSVHVQLNTCCLQRCPLFPLSPLPVRSFIPSSWSATYLSFRLQSQSCLIFCDILFDSLEWD